MCTTLCKKENVSLRGREIVLRNPVLGDADAVLRLINSLVKEDAPIRANRKFTLKEETEWLKKMIGFVKKNKVHAWYAFAGKEYVGNATLEKGFLRQSHVGTIGIALKKSYRGIGFGTLLLRKIIEITKQDKEIKVLTLGVLPKNAGAQRLYEKLGFKTIAKLPNRILYKGKYMDEYIMDYPLAI